MIREPKGLCRAEGFSLIEVVLALGVIGFALIAILGMFPLAMNASKDSQHETRAAFIAQSIFSQVQAGHPTNTSVPVGESLTDPSTSTGNVGLNLTSGATNFWMIFNESGTAVGRATLAQFNNGNTLPSTTKSRNPVYQAQLRVFRNQPTNGLSLLVVDVVNPALAPAESRQTNVFVTTVRNSP